MPDAVLDSQVLPHPPSSSWEFAHVTSGFDRLNTALKLIVPCWKAQARTTAWVGSDVL